MAGEKRKTKSKNYHDYIIKNGKFIGAFEEMYKNVDDPWYHGKADAIQYDLALYLINRQNVKGKILDIGCSKGAFTARLKRNTPESYILAVDIAPTAIKKAQKKYGKLGIDFEVMDIQKEYKNIKEKFDLIVVSQIMWYILPNFRKIMQYLIKNVIKKEGYLLVNQTFYKPKDQKYGNKIVQTPEEMIRLINLAPVEMIETNRFAGHNVIAIFKK